MISAAGDSVTKPAIRLQTLMDPVYNKYTTYQTPSSTLCYPKIALALLNSSQDSYKMNEYAEKINISTETWNFRRS